MLLPHAKPSKVVFVCECFLGLCATEIAHYFSNVQLQRMYESCVFCKQHISLFAILLRLLTKLTTESPATHCNFTLNLKGTNNTKHPRNSVLFFLSFSLWFHFPSFFYSSLSFFPSHNFPVSLLLFQFFFPLSIFWDYIHQIMKKKSKKKENRPMTQSLALFAPSCFSLSC